MRKVVLRCLLAPVLGTAIAAAFAGAIAAFVYVVKAIGRHVSAETAARGWLAGLALMGLWLVGVLLWAGWSLAGDLLRGRERA